MASPFARMRRARDDDPAPTEATEALPAPVDREFADAPAATEVVATGGQPEPEGDPGFLRRGKLRRRLRYLRRAREIALRDLGGLIFDLHRFGRARTDLVDQKLAGLGALDREMRLLEHALDDRREVTVLREPGLGSCPRCGALRPSDANFCSSCGLPLGKGAGLPAGPIPAGPTEPFATVPSDPAPKDEQPTQAS
jgi:hypothetical protein